MVMKVLRDGAKGGFTKFILFGFLVLAVGGLVLMDVGGFFRGGVSNTDVARVGDKSISIASFDRNLRRTLQQLGMSPQDAYRAGFVNQLLSSDIRALLVAQSANKLGVSIPEDVVAQQVAKLIAPMTTNGQSPKDVLTQILRSQGMGEAEFAHSIARDMGNRLVATAIESSFQMPSDNMLTDLYKFKKETRDIEFITFLDKDVAGTEPPTEEQLQNLYNASREAYAQPETRTMKLVMLNTAELEKSIAISDEDIQHSYDSNIDLYTANASWTLDQALVSSKEDAEAIYTAVTGGKSLQQATTDEASASSYIGTEDYPEQGILEELRETVVANETEGKVLEPVKSPLGWHVIQVKKINPKRTRPLAEVKDEIKKDLMEAQIIDQQYELANSVDDMLAGGATLDEVAEQIDLNIVSLPPMNEYGLNKDGKDALKDYAEIRTSVLETGFTLNEGETSAIFESADGKFMAVHLDVMTPKTYTPFEEVKQTLGKRWMDDQNRMNNKMRLTQLLAKMKAGDESLAAVAKAERKAIKTKNGLARVEKNEELLPARAIDNLFEAGIGEPLLIDIKDGAAIAVVTNYTWPTVDTSSADFKTFKSTYADDLKNETLGMYLTKQQDKYKATINQRLLEQVYGPEAQAY